MSGFSYASAALKAKDVTPLVTSKPRPYNKQAQSTSSTSEATSWTTNKDKSYSNKKDTNYNKVKSNYNNKNKDKDSSYANKNYNKKNYNSNREPLKHIIYGDSFVRLFGLIKSNKFLVKAFKGSTAKGLTRSANENRLWIEKHFKKQSEVENVIFGFGNVDVHLSYYYSKYTKGVELDYTTLADDYVKFVAELKASQSKESTTQFSILGVYPSSLEDENVRMSLFLYGALPEEIKDDVTDDDILLSNRQARVSLFNNALRDKCAEYEIQYIDMNEQLMNPDTMLLNDDFRDVADMNIHVVWETTLALYMERYELQFLKSLATPEFSNELKASLMEYLKTKPWANDEKNKHLTSVSLGNTKTEDGGEGGEGYEEK